MPAAASDVPGPESRVAASCLQCLGWFSVDILGLRTQARPCPEACWSLLTSMKATELTRPPDCAVCWKPQ